MGVDPDDFSAFHGGRLAWPAIKATRTEKRVEIRELSHLDNYFY
jgi:hypothetical protein